MLPESLKAPLQVQLKKVKTIHERDLVEGRGRVQMPNALDRKYPKATADWRWQWVFPQENRWINPKTKEQGHHHIDESLIHKAVRDAAYEGRFNEAGHLPYFPAFLRDSLALRWLRYSNSAGTPGPQ